MTQNERRQYLIRELLKERPRYRNMPVPSDSEEQKQLLRSLMNIRMPMSIGKDFLKVQDEYLREAIEEKGITDLKDLTPIREELYLWRGDITTLRCDAIVNAANSGMTGCYQPCHACIDNCIHTYAGIQLRLACDEIIQKQKHAEPTGTAKITEAYNLPCRYVLHTVGPIVEGELTRRHREQLASCYLSCLELAETKRCDSIAFCCISTGVFRFPADKAAQIAVDTVRGYKADTGSRMKVIFNVFSRKDEDIYRNLLEPGAGLWG